jgi:endonuclease/exonuclease/phosphatase family metal-dependent hydrolase
MRPIRAILAAAVAVIATVPLAGDARATGHPQTYLQFNMCGNACHRGGLEVVGDLVSPIQRHRPYAVTLNEVCENQYDRLRVNLPGYRSWFDPTGANCRNGARYGNVILAQASEVNLIGSWELPNPAGDELRRLLCLDARASDRRPLTICVTHISNESGNIAAQVAAVASILSGLRLTGPVLLGGDFNTDPGDARMNPLYSTCYTLGAGTFREVDSSGCEHRSGINVKVGSDVINEDTYAGRKFDYLFLSDGQWSAVEADAMVLAPSDHDSLWATATLRPTGVNG